MTMKGFRIKYNDKVYFATSPLPVIGIDISNKSAAFRLNISGMDNNGLTHQWHSDRLQSGDEIEITFGDFDESSSPAKIFDYSDPAVQEKMMLEEYYLLKKELEEENLI